MLCLDAWEMEPSKDAFGGMLIGVMLGGISGKAGEGEAERRMMEKEKISADAVRTRKEQVVFLRAKLIQLRNRMAKREAVTIES